MSASIQNLPPSVTAAQLLSHWAADYIAEFGPVTTSALDEELEYALSETDYADEPRLTLSDGASGVQCSTGDGYSAKFSELIDSSQGKTVVESVELTRGRPSGLESLHSLVDSESGEMGSNDFTVVDDLEQEHADLLAEEGIFTYTDVVAAGSDALSSVPGLTKSAIRDLESEASQRTPDQNPLATESYDRAVNTPTNEDGTAISYHLNRVKQPAASPLDPSVHGDDAHYHSWHVLEESDHPGIPDSPGPIKERVMKNGKTDLENICESFAKRKPVLLIGEPGTGKNTLLKKVAHETNRSHTVIPMDERIQTQELMGIHTVTEDGAVVFEPGGVPEQVKYGGMLVVDEINAAPAGILKALHKLAEENPTLTVKGSNEFIEAHPEFYLAATMNPHAAGTGEIARALSSRFTPLVIDRLPQAAEVDLIDKKVNSDREVIQRDKIEKLVRYANNKRNDYLETGRGQYVTTRDIYSMVDLASDGGNLAGAVDMVMKGIQLAGISGPQTPDETDEALIEHFGHPPEADAQTGW